MKNPKNRRRYRLRIVPAPNRHLIAGTVCGEILYRRNEPETRALILALAALWKLDAEPARVVEIREGGMGDGKRSTTRC
jgi:hypothetical protein